MQKKRLYLKDTTWREALLKHCMENGISGASLQKIILPLAGKTEGEKEKMAKEALEKLLEEMK